MKLERADQTDTNPIGDTAITQLRHAMQGAFTVDADGTHTLVGADFSVHDWMEFWMGENTHWRDLVEDLINGYQEYKWMYEGLAK